MSKVAMPKSFSRIWIAASGWEKYVQHEVGPQAYRWGRMFMWPSDAGEDIPHSFWAENTWYSPSVRSYASIGDASKQLRAIQRNWTPHVEEGLHCRTKLIQESLPSLSSKRRSFPFELPPANMGAFCLLDKKSMIVSPSTESPFAGPLLFEENHNDPPSTAYLKLWEALSRMGRRPAPGERCLDVGAYPGSWTWVLGTLGAEVLAIDRQPLTIKLTNPRIRFQTGNAFLVVPETLHEYGWNQLDWLCSDLVCYPSKLFPWVKCWFDSGLVKNFVVSIKMQGEPDWETCRLFADLPGGKLFHGGYNKHELTWVWPWHIQHDKQK